MARPSLVQGLLPPALLRSWDVAHFDRQALKVNAWARQQQRARDSSSSSPAATLPDKMLASLRPQLVARLAQRAAVAVPIRPSVAAYSTKLYVGNLSWDAQKDDLFQLFGAYGEVEDAFIPSDRATGRSRGFAFVTLTNGGAEAIEALNETEFKGRTIRVNEAEERPPGDRPPRPEGGFRSGPRPEGGFRGGPRSEGGGRSYGRGRGGGGGRGYGGGGGRGYSGGGGGRGGERRFERSERSGGDGGDRY